MENIKELSLEELMVLVIEKKKEKFGSIIKEIEKLGENEKEELKELLGWKVSYEWGGNKEVEEVLKKGNIKFNKNKYNYEFSIEKVKYNCRNLDKVKLSFGRGVDINKMLVKLSELGLKGKENYGIEVEDLTLVVSKVKEIGKLVISLK